MKIINAVMLGLTLLFTSGCYMDEVTPMQPAIVYYNGSYGYWYNSHWYVAPPGYVYGHPIYWGPCYHHNGYYRPYGYAPARPYHMAPPVYHHGGYGWHHR